MCFEEGVGECSCTADLVEVAVDAVVHEVHTLHEFVIVGGVVDDAQHFHSVGGPVEGPHLFLQELHQTAPLLPLNHYATEVVQKDGEANHHVRTIPHNLVELDFMPDLVLTYLPLIDKAYAIHKYWYIFF